MFCHQVLADFLDEFDTYANFRTWMFDTAHQERADLVLAVPCGFDPINLPTTCLATDRRNHLPLMMEVQLHHRLCREKMK